MLRTLIAGAGAGVLLSAGLVAPPAGADYKPYGATSAATQELKPGCDFYYYRYRITVPSEDWGAETFLIGPHGGRVASGVLLPVSDPVAGRARFRLCRPSLVAGRYKIRMRVTFTVDYDKFEGFVTPSYFRLVRRR
jgi:hypothetical protein